MPKGIIGIPDPSGKDADLLIRLGLIWDEYKKEWKKVANQTKSEQQKIKKSLEVFKRDHRTAQQSVKNSLNQSVKDTKKSLTTMQSALKKHRKQFKKSMDVKKPLTQARTQMQQFLRYVKFWAARMILFWAVFKITRGVQDFTSGIIEQTRALDKHSRIVGIGTQKLRGYQFAARINLLTAERLKVALDFLNKAILEATTVGGDAKVAFENLGISMDELRGMNTDQALNRVADAIKNTTDVTKKANAATALFGRGGRDMLAVIDKGSEGLKEYSKQARKLGLVLDEDVTNRIVETGKRIEEMKAAFKGAGIQMGLVFVPTVDNAVIPALRGIAKWSMEAAAGLRFLWGITSLGEDAFFKSKRAFEEQRDVVRKLREEIGNTIKILDKLAVDAPIEFKALDKLGIFGDLIEKGFTKVSNVLKPTNEALDALRERSKELNSELGIQEKLLKIVAEQWEEMRKKFFGIADAEDEAKKKLKELTTQLEALTKTLTAGNSEREKFLASLKSAKLSSEELTPALRILGIELKDLLPGKDDNERFKKFTELLRESGLILEKLKKPSKGGILDDLKDFDPNIIVTIEEFTDVLGDKVVRVVETLRELPKIDWDEIFPVPEIPTFEDIEIRRQEQAVEALRLQYKQLAEDLDAMNDPIAVLEGSFNNFFDSIREGGKNAREILLDLFEDILKGFIQMLTQMIAKWLATQAILGIASLALAAPTGGASVGAGAVGAQGFRRFGLPAFAKEGGIFESPETKRKLPHFQKGGFVTRGVGSIPAILHPDEVVLPKNWIRDFFGSVATKLLNFGNIGSIAQPSSFAFAGAGGGTPNININVVINDANLTDSVTKRRISREIVDGLEDEFRRRGRVFRS